MNDRAARIAAMLGIAPISFALFYVLGAMLEGRQVKPADPIQLACAGAIAFSLITASTLWKPYVDWKPRTHLLTWIGLLIVGIHLAVFEPIWSVGCTEDILTTAQSVGLYGLWRLTIPLIWWGAFVFFRRRAKRRIGGKREMTPNAIRLVIGLALIPLLPCLWYVIGETLTEKLSFSDDNALAVSVLITMSTGIVIWTLLWRPVVRWTGRLIVLTCVLTALLFLAAFSSYVTVADPSARAIINMSPIWMWGVWMMGTAWLWRTRHGINQQSREVELGAVEPACLQCGYSLRGLTEVRCPECGWTGTIDAVMAETCVEDV